MRYIKLIIAVVILLALVSFATSFLKQSILPTINQYSTMMDSLTQVTEEALSTLGAVQTTETEATSLQLVVRPTTNAKEQQKKSTEETKPTTETQTTEKLFDFETSTEEAMTATAGIVSTSVADTIEGILTKILGSLSSGNVSSR